MVYDGCFQKREIGWAITASSEWRCVLGAGHIGGAVARAIVDDAAAIERIQRVAATADRWTVRNIDAAVERESGSMRDSSRLTVRRSSMTRDVHVVVEAMGGEQPAADLMARALAAGKHVVTANKEAVAKQMPSIAGGSRDGDAGFLCEASVGGGIPLIVALRQILATNRVESVRGIVNGTTNFILSKMDAEGADYAPTLAEAQAAGLRRAGSDCRCRGLRRELQARDPGVADARSPRPSGGDRSHRHHGRLRR